METEASSEPALKTLVRGASVGGSGERGGSGGAGGRSPIPPSCGLELYGSKGGMAGGTGPEGPQGSTTQDVKSVPTKASQLKLN
ncbi:hypothetical protein BH09MYX1_BH09MYX1_40560 [soil metagenome]